jgi:hypothetical protein
MLREVLAVIVLLGLWLACHTQEEIAETVGCDQDTVSDISRKMADLPESVKPVAAHQVDFDVPLYNVWKQQDNVTLHPNPIAATLSLVSRQKL